MLSAIAIDDEPMPLRILKEFAAQVHQVDLIRTFSNTAQAKLWLKENPVDLLFLDINMPAISGLDFVKTLESDYMIIFTTAHAKYAVDGFNLNAVDYLLKPFDIERFRQAVLKASDYADFKQHRLQNEIFVKSDYTVVKVNTSEILFVEAYSDYLKINLENQPMVVTRMTMTAISEMLPKEFLRVHRSYIINRDKVSTISSRRVEIGSHSFPIGKTYYKEVKDLLRRD